ncbi:MAG TPA: pyruvate dehydrogenase complex dihydrolipoamide acetyltransferase [Alphaproteobacteria bacterium]|nr:pyruvate dehydrogenase complex dihydrolipoamide acetyltransferase [Alphaproteobacteria bacterium]
MSVSVLMPALSPTMTEGTLARWLVKEGDSVKSGDVIAEIETDKATMEVEALDDGVVAKLAVAEGTQNVAVNAVIAVLAEDGESVDDALAAVATEPAAAPSTPPQKDAPAAAPAAATSPVQPAVTPELTARSDRVFASPLARRIAADAGLELARLSGTGPHGRIIRADVEAALASGASGAAVQPAAVSRTASAAVPPEERFVSHNAMRRVIADRLQQSKQTAPHFYLTVDCEIDNLLAARKALNEAAEDGVKISVNDMVVKAAAAALMAEPDVNGYFEAEGCRYFSTADICVAVAVDGGLVTPVIHDVQNLGLADISRKTSDLASRARAGTLDPSEYAGGSFTISNLGMFGIREFAAVINPPQSAILAVGAGEQRPVVKNGELAVATVMTVTLSADHRIVDGALGAKWLQAFKRAIEQPVTMLL